MYSYVEQIDRSSSIPACASNIVNRHTSEGNDSYLIMTMLIQCSLNFYLTLTLQYRTYTHHLKPKLSEYTCSLLALYLLSTCSLLLLLISPYPFCSARTDSPRLLSPQRSLLAKITRVHNDWSVLSLFHSELLLQRDLRVGVDTEALFEKAKEASERRLKLQLELLLPRTPGELTQGAAQEAIARHRIVEEVLGGHPQLRLEHGEEGEVERWARV